MGQCASLLYSSPVPTASSRRAAACGVHSMPDELLVEILKCCSFRDLASAEQADHGKPWGQVDIANNILLKILAGPDHDLTTAALKQDESLRNVKPFCRWLSARAAGIGKIKLDFNFWRGKDGNSNVAIANADLLIYSLLPMLLALLMIRGSRVDLELQLEGCSAEYTTLAQQGLVVHEMAAHVVALSTSSCAVATMSSRAFAGICKLTGLTSLKLQNLEAEQGQQLSLQALSQLPALQHLELYSSWQGRLQLQVPPELSRLSVLSWLTLYGFASCSNVFAGLPSLTYLNLAQRIAFNRPVNLVSDLLSVPHSLARTVLPRLAEIRLENLKLGSSLLGLSCLTSLTYLSITWCTSGSEVSVAACLSAALRCLNQLRHLSIKRSTACIDSDALSGLAALTSLGMINADLLSMHCSSRWCSLRILELRANKLAGLPVNLAVLSSLTHLDLSHQAVDFQVAQSLLPILRALPLLTCVMLQQSYRTVPGGQLHQWDGTSVIYLVEAAEDKAFRNLSLSF